jgi:hypothetical protein
MIITILSTIQRGLPACKKEPTGPICRDERLIFKINLIPVFLSKIKRTLHTSPTIKVKFRQAKIFWKEIKLFETKTIWKLREQF